MMTQIERFKTLPPITYPSALVNKFYSYVMYLSSIDASVLHCSIDSSVKWGNSTEIT